MPAVPAYCPKCNIYFESPFFVGTGFDGEIYFEGNQIPCVKCNGIAKVEGLVKVVGDAVDFIHTSNLTNEDIERLRFILQQAVVQKKSADEITKEITKDVPAAAGLNKFITDHAGLYSLILLLVSVLQIAAPYIKQPGEPIDVEKIVQAVIKAQKSHTPVPTPANTNRRVNDPCWCGSGRKAKKCHGAK
jgi:hypothetical protein